MGSKMSVAIVGVAESDLGITGKSIYQLQTQAASLALGEAGLTFADLDSLATMGVKRLSATSMPEYWGIQPSWVTSTMEPEILPNARDRGADALILDLEDAVSSDRKFGKTQG